MKSWPKKRSKTIKPSELIFPIKKYLLNKYRFIKKNKPMPSSFEGYNFGKEELKSLPDISVYFSEKYEQHCGKQGLSSFDMALFAVFLLGVEQGRRKERQSTFSEQILNKLLIKRTNDLKELKKKLEELESKSPSINIQSGS